MDRSATMRYKRVLLTGPPGIGKTTICKKLISIIDSNFKFDGFYTEEVRASNGSRMGFDVVLLNNSEIRAPLARIPLDNRQGTTSQAASKYRVGNYNVFVDDFEKIALPVLQSKADILLIDEIGKMELFSQKFLHEVERIFFEDSSKGRCIIATIPLLHKVPQRHLAFFEKLRSTCKIIDVNRQNRDSIPQEISKNIFKTFE